MKDNSPASCSELEQALVVELDGDFALLELETAEACGCCTAKAACQLNENGKRTLRIKNSIGANPGETVLIRQYDLNQLKLSAVHYGFPLLAFLAAIILTQHFISSPVLCSVPKDVWQFIIGVAALLLAGVIAKRWSYQQAQAGFRVYELVNEKQE